MSDRARPDIRVVTVMKDEAPFILEWIAWLQVIGVTKAIVLTNDCSDGTDEMLDRLEELGHVHHLPNPVFLAESGGPHQVALRYAPFLKSYRDADYILHNDVDEFIVPHRHGDLPSMLEAFKMPHAVSICEQLFGASGHAQYEDDYVTKRFTRSMPIEPGETRARRGVKTLFKNDDRLWRNRRNHRPVVRWGLDTDLAWCDGSGAQLDEEFIKGREPGLDCAGRSDAVTLNHYSVRSAEDYIGKLVRGDAAKSGRTQGRKYWRKRNRNDVENRVIEPFISALEAEYERLRNDTRLDALHTKAATARAAELQAARQSDQYSELFDWCCQTEGREEPQ